MKRNRSESKDRRKIAKAVGKPWDWVFMIDIEKAKLKTMLKYFEKFNVTENSHIIVRDIKLAMSLCDIISEDGYIDRRCSGLYVNIKNINRLPEISTESFNAAVNNRCNKPYLLAIIRCEKAWMLYNKLRFYRMRTWWD